MFFFHKHQLEFCPKCHNAVEIRNAAHSHAFDCPICRSHIFWDAAHQKLEADTRRSKIAHKQWNESRRARAAATASGSSCLLPALAVLGILAGIIAFL